MLHPLQFILNVPGAVDKIGPQLKRLTTVSQEEQVNLYFRDPFTTALRDIRVPVCWTLLFAQLKVVIESKD